MKAEVVVSNSVRRADLMAACDDARAGVASSPADETAAEALFEVVSAAAEAFKTAQSPIARNIPQEVATAAQLLQNGRDEEAEILLRRYLSVVRNDPDAMLLMAQIAVRCGFPENAEKILRRSVDLHPDRKDNWVALARILHERAQKADQVGLVDEALDALDRALTVDPSHEDALAYKAALLVQVRQLDRAEIAFERLLKVHPANGPGWINLAHLLKTVGRFGAAIAAYRTAIALDPLNGIAWWLLADLKLARFFPADVARMEAALAQPLAQADRIGLHFALATALDQAKDYAGAAEHLEHGNALRLKDRPHDIAAMKRSVDAAVEVYTPQFFSARETVGDPDPAPIFIVGMPRSGSTLVEQILSSHSSIEGTAELFAVQQIEVELFREHETEAIERIVGGLAHDEFRRLGSRYLDLTRFHRRTNRERFIDKNPGNWRQVGFIRTMLPGAHIIDIRRNPLDCCFANYAQHFMIGVNYSYGFEELASQYRQYVRLMRHFDEVIPGAVHRIIYEDLVEDIEGEVRRLMDYLELPFEDGCLRFFETVRPVHTPSSEQVRQPINRSGIGKSTKYEPWLGDLKNMLGELLSDWRQ